jgi:hypothetical protein
MKNKVAVDATNLATRIRARFANLDDVNLAIPKREPVRAPPHLEVGSTLPRVVHPVLRKP